MRYEKLDLELSTAACATLLAMLEPHAEIYLRGGQAPSEPAAELVNLTNELRARLQRTDVDQHAPKNQGADPNADLLG